jgi:hypothetical protein
MNNLRTGLVNLINDLNTIARNSDDTDQQDEIIKLLRVLHTLLDEVVRRELDADTPQYQEALGVLKAATAQASAAVEDLRKTAEAIKTAVKAAKAVDQVVQLLGKFAA